MTDESIDIPFGLDMVSLFGENDRHLRDIESHFNIMFIGQQENSLGFRGTEENIRHAKKLINLVVKDIHNGVNVSKLSLKGLMMMVTEHPDLEEADLVMGVLKVHPRKDRIHGQNLNQFHYIRSLQESVITLGIGPAGTGKTYLAVAAGLSLLEKGIVRRLVLTRPVLEAGENLGFLPGDLDEKINPYIRPLLDAILDMIPGALFSRLRSQGILELAPLAYMRGRTLNNAYIVLDEAQNTSPSQMKMLLTRLGKGSRLVVTGDPSQTDRARNEVCGLTIAQKALASIPSVSTIIFQRQDVVRHPLIQSILEGFEAHGF